MTTRTRTRTIKATPPASDCTHFWSESDRPAAEGCYSLKCKYCGGYRDYPRDPALAPGRVSSLQRTLLGSDVPAVKTRKK
jgi:hypothetical protein